MFATEDIQQEKKSLLGMSDEELRQTVKELGMPAFTGGQIAKWMYGNPEKSIMSIDEMTNISKKNREILAEHYEIGAMAPIDSQLSKDGTKKYLFPTQNGKRIETVFIPDGDRATLCVSCQVGCKMNCLFCQTGKQGFEGQLHKMRKISWMQGFKRIYHLYRQSRTCRRYRREHKRL